jgi:excinuclease ABC subunit C
MQEEELYFFSKDEELKETVRNLPQEPGVYRYFDKNNEILYVGKAKNLKKRVSSYFTKQHPDAKTQILVRQIARIEITVVRTENDALLLENNLIKSYQPPYNILLRDGKRYPYIAVTHEPFPRVLYTREVKSSSATYYGPFTNHRAIEALLELFKKIYTIRTCELSLAKKNIEAGKFKVCLEYHIKNCKGPCQGLQTEEEYLLEIEQIKNILSGKIGFAKTYFKEQMLKASENLEFEKAHKLKEKYKALEDYQSKSLITSPNISNLEVFTVSSDSEKAYLNYMMIENGCIVRTNNALIKKRLNESDEDILSFTIVNYRERFRSQAEKIITNIPTETDFGKKIEILVPKIGDYKKLLELSLKNLEVFRAEEERRAAAMKAENKKNPVLEQLKKDLNLEKLPLHIECFDNSHHQGDSYVSSMVCFKNGKPAKSEYRKYNIKTVEGIDDFKAMYEVVFRRYKRVLDESLPMPDLIVIDGGKGQLSFACDALKDLDLYGKISIVALAKRLEEVFYPNDSEPLLIGRKSPSLRLLQHIRNEAHRFAITFHRTQKTKNAFKSELLGIKGLGARTIEKLLTHFKSLRKIKEADEKSLQALIGRQKMLILKHKLNELKDENLE